MRADRKERLYYREQEESEGEGSFTRTVVQKQVTERTSQTQAKIEQARE